MKLERVVGDIVQIDPKFSEMEIIWVTREDIVEPTSKPFSSDYSPAFWFIYNEDLYLGVCDYSFYGFETYDDWKISDELLFNEYFPREGEINKLLSLNPTYFKANPDEIFKSDLDEYCEFELDFIKVWNRDKKIKELLK